MNKTDRWNKLAAFTVIFIVWGHHMGHTLSHYIFSFHVPLLFFLFGIKYHPESNSKSFIKEQTRLLLIPYFLYSIILYAIWFIVSILTNEPNFLPHTILTNLGGIFYSQGMNETMAWGLHMWFFPCLFITSLISQIIIKTEKNPIIFWLLTSISLVIGIFLSRILSFNLPWSLDIAFTSTAFFITGYKINKLDINLKLYRKITLSLLFLTGGYYLQSQNMTFIDLKQHTYGNPILFVSSSFLSIFAYFLIAESINNSKVTGFIGSYLIPVFVFHLAIWPFINSIIGHITKIYYYTGIVETLLLSIIQIFIIIYITILISYLYKISPLFSNTIIT